ncbi:cupin [uncultured Aquimarina sp.]|uniref:cupin n=1 Tax=uncultured Aquimarina sp. TaxID=575652 RepID=UPI002627F231|nr:cupin [uncultured Aquimarina sp.]
MKIVASLNEGLAYNEDRPAINILLETETSKEIRIVFRKGQIMKKHHTPFPIVVEVFKGVIDFGVENEKEQLTAGSIIALSGGVPHDLTALEDSIVRLSLSKQDKLKRVKNIKTA